MARSMKGPSCFSVDSVMNEPSLRDCERVLTHN